MLSVNNLVQFLEQSTLKYPDRVAVEEPGVGVLAYRELSSLSDQVRDRLRFLGVQRGDRVGIYLHKSIDSLATIFGILKAGAAYVPVDPGAPPSRNAYIFQDCAVKVIVVERGVLEGLKNELARSESAPQLIVLDGTGGGAPLRESLRALQAQAPAPQTETEPTTPNDLAYILYTSGSTGKPKGVMLTHRAAVSYVDWCSEVFQPDEIDRFSSHAPFHFDLSILDLYVPIKHGARVVLISEEVGKDPARLAALIADTQITVWYSTPSILSFLAQFGKLENYDYSKLRTVLFAGEVFPIKYLRLLKELWPHPKYFNLYGPTETNVCTYFELPEVIPADQDKPFPIGKACSHYEIKVVNDEGDEVPAGEEGELVARGLGVMIGYWNLPERTATAFLVDEEGQRWYRTGDIVYEDQEGNYVYVSRRDRMVKKRGYRVELGEIEAGLYRHPAVREAAVIALQNDDEGVRIKAFLSCVEGQRPSIINLKRFCLDALPSYMVPDYFSILDVLPKTSTDKIDYQKLKSLE